MLDIENVTYTYATKDEASLKNINLHVKDGECLLLCGKSGCGKSSVLRLVNGMIPIFYEGTMAGNVKIKGQSTENMPMYELAKIAGTVFQNPRTQFYTVNTTSEIAFGLENMGLPREKIKERVMETARDLGIEYLLNRSIFELSGGEKQIIAFASVYAMNPDIYLLDEPSANLDFDAIERLRKILVLLKKQGKTIIVAEHRIFYLKEIMDRAIYMSEGQIVKEYSLEELDNMTQADHENTGIRALTLGKFEGKAWKQELSLNNPKTLTIKKLSGYYGKKKAVSIEQASFKAGCINAIIGHNGAGKSTFVSALTGLLKKTDGSLSIENRPLNKRNRIRESFIVLQEVNHQLFSDSVEEEILLGADTQGNEEKYLEILKQLDLTKVKDCHPMTLSGGQKQRVIIASARFSNKRIIVFDEPTSGLDYTHMQKTINLINEIKDENTFIFVVTHDYEFILSSCDTVSLIEKGCLKEQYALDPAGTEKFKGWFLAGN